MTVREAERVLRTRYPHILDDSDLASREAAGLALTKKSNVVGDDVEEGEEQRIHQGMVKALLAYGAEPSVPEDSDFGNTLLHLAPTADDPVAFARLPRKHRRPLLCSKRRGPVAVDLVLRNGGGTITVLRSGDLLNRARLRRRPGRGRLRMSIRRQWNSHCALG